MTRTNDTTDLGLAAILKVGELGFFLPDIECMFHWMWEIHSISGESITVGFGIPTALNLVLGSS